MNLLCNKFQLLRINHMVWTILLCVLIEMSCRVVALAQSTENSVDPLVSQNPETPDPFSMFQAGVKMFEDGFYLPAQENFEEWLQLHSDHELKKQVAEYAVWSRAEHAISKSDYSLAADYFSELLRDFPGSKHRLDHAFGEAWSRFFLQQYSRVSELLTNENSPYVQSALRTETTGDPRATMLRLKGQLLLAETWLKMGEYERTKDVLDSIPDWSLSDELVWRREFLLTQLLLEEGDLVEARQSASRLLAWARSIESVDWIAESVALKGDVLKENGQLAAALETYQENLADFIPESRRREARLKIIELNLLKEDTGTVVELLSDMMQKSSSDASLDIVLVTLGELSLKQYYRQLDAPLSESGLPASPGDLLTTAKRYLETLLKDFPSSIYNSRGSYALGWCLWELGEYPTCLQAFDRAATGLDKSLEQAECLFKQGDVHLKTGDSATALKLYKTLFSEYEYYNEVRNLLFEQGYYQMLRAAIQANALTDAEYAAQKLMSDYPNGPLTQRSRLLLGQRLVHVNQIPEARERFMNLVEKFGQFPLRAEVDLALAHTYEREGAWSAALAAYEKWLAKYKDHPKLARAEYALAWVNDRLGNTQKALALFQQFVRVHGQHEFVPFAQNWIADYFFNLGNFQEAESAYARIANELKQSTASQKRQSILMMAKCHFRVGNHAKVVELLVPLKDEFDQPETIDKDFAGEVFLCLGDAYFAIAQKAEEGTQENSEAAGNAISAYISVYAVHRPNRWESIAWGRSGDLEYYLGDDYPAALRTYNTALGFPNVSISMRSQLEYSIGQVKQRMADSAKGQEQVDMRQEALQHFLNIVYLKNLKRGENPDAFWIRKAGIRVMELLEETRDWDQAKRFSAYLSELMPAQKDEWLRMMTQWNQRLALEASPASQ